MSTSTSASTTTTTTNPPEFGSIHLRIAGGLPDHTDLAPSAVFLVLYALLIPLYALAWKKNCIGRWFMVRPAVFIVMRIAFFALRLVLVEEGTSEGVLIAEMVLISIGFIFLVDATIVIWEYQRDRQPEEHEHAGLLSRFLKLSRVSLVAAIATGTAAGGLTGQALSDPDTMSTVVALRKACYILSLIVVAVMLGLHAHSVFLGHAKIGWGISCSALVYTAVLVVIAVYRLITAEESNPRAAVLSKTAFWILQVALEWVAVVSLLLITVYAGNYYSGREFAEVDERENENGNWKMEMRGRGQGQEAVSPPGYSSDAGKAGSSV
ncbi:hypothetical protein FFLO_03690 [Filobasidium floriforme]|uniref:Uncharacterized protein n=1 Tax=Filobasidium floriforme TaxID=5210 RepID=A0A8K0NQK8_9TREE|nr:hypothetical protein FFLO_03690 [Filobasidium floriforme]